MTFKMPWEGIPAKPVYDANEHFARVKERWNAYPLRTQKACDAHCYQLLFDLFKPRAPWMVGDAIRRFVQELYKSEGLYKPPEPHLSTRESLDRQHAMLSPLRLDVCDQATKNFLRRLIDVLPASAFEDARDLDNEPWLSICHLIPDGRLYPNAAFYHFADVTIPGTDEYAFADLRSTLYHNLIRASGYTPNTWDGKRKLKLPHELDGSTEQVLETCLINTPLLSLLADPVPFKIPLDSYKEHGFLFAKSGHGKTQTLRALFASLIKEDCALFLIDGNGSLIENIDRINGIQDRLIVLDPLDVPALNFYKLRGGSREKQMELFFYLFKAIEQSLTERQATMVSFLVDFMHAIPNSTLDTLREVCDAKDLPYQEYLRHTPQITQDFFQKQFLSNDQLIKQTRSQIAARLYALCRNKTFIDMFSAPENKFDAFKAMQDKRIVIVNTTRNELGDHGSAIFGRFVLAQCLAAAFQRPKNERHLALIICDEAKAYLDDQSQKILSDARAFGLGLLLASQFPDQLGEGVRKEVVNNTTIKFAGPAAYSVVAQIHRDMRCQPDFILGMKKKIEGAEWACYVDNVTPQAIRLTVPFGAVEHLSQLSPAQHAIFRAENKARYGKGLSIPPPPGVSIDPIEQTNVVPLRPSPTEAPESPPPLPPRPRHSPR